MYGQQADWMQIKEITFDEIVDVYVKLDTPTTKAIRSVKVTNMTDVTVYVSNNPSIDQMKLPPGSYEFWDITTNKALSDKPQFIPIGTQFYCRNNGFGNPVSGYVSIEALVVETGS